MFNVGYYFHVWYVTSQIKLGPKRTYGKNFPEGMNASLIITQAFSFEYGKCMASGHLQSLNFGAYASQLP